MPVNVADVLSRAAYALSDVDETRWSAQTKLDYFNDGLLEIATQKPSAFSRTAELPLDVGTLQTVPEGYANLIRVVRNLSNAQGATTRVGGRVVTPSSKEVLNDRFINWHDPDVVPYSKIVMHVMADEFEPRKFYVFPGNDGTGLVEAVLAVIPDTVAGPITSATTAPIDQTYFNALHNYVCYRCYGEDMILNGAPARAQAHYQMFQGALGIKQMVEGVANVNTTNIGSTP
ncbi:hypothetical protein RAZWK3B_16690 [Roseobacter sp. AzwK-3b]|uniref:phage adaptor protein n=1 Tax=Roseobacter sp. AzwK-3b TaxID=351016 RepID=UPI000156988A|nr:DUF6682 family protein [Roseobacter sp. AzwK-3b]EDM71053.1 hypothetical protein RAZWK3B_16690 [Roseobacter sp. AzwK-3b]